jgi:demethylmenaquinone methyltransferase/2-methoxy-6-polyprenyl-1,4-benzoquinol methylase
MTGTTPPGVGGEQAAARWVREMFGRIVPHYDLLNHLLSFNLDRRWRARTVERVAGVMARPGARVLDLCCGTGDLLMALEDRSLACPEGAQAQKEDTTEASAILGSDFCHPMLVEAQRKIAERRLRAPLFEADALALPLADGALDLITIAFGFRNLEELRRVLKPGGVAAILEFSQPTNRAFGAVYRFFSTCLLPWIGGLISGSHDAYSYLPESIRNFPGADDLAGQMLAAGFVRVEFERMTGGAVALHLGWK